MTLLEFPWILQNPYWSFYGSLWKRLARLIRIDLAFRIYFDADCLFFCKRKAYRCHIWYRSMWSSLLFTGPNSNPYHSNSNLTLISWRIIALTAIKYLICIFLTSSVTRLIGDSKKFIWQILKAQILFYKNPLRKYKLGQVWEMLDGSAILYAILYVVRGRCTLQLLLPGP